MRMMYSDQNISFEKKIENDIILLSSAICDSVNCYYDGDILGATNIFNKVIDDTFKQPSFASENLFVLGSIRERTQLYRARPRHSGLWLKDEMFHIPFEKRHLVSTNRYSIPGLPALYASTDAYSCWTELGKPELKDLNYVRLETTRTLKVLKLMYVHDMIYELFDPHGINESIRALFGTGLQVGDDPISITQAIMKISNYLSTFPLVIACTVRALNNNVAFKPEYIIPQLLLQNLQKDGAIDGIRYPSTKKGSFKIGHVDKFHNYVFPVKNAQKMGFCPELVDKFRSTDPTSLRNEKQPDNSGKKNILGDQLLLNFYPIEVGLKKRLTYTL